MLLYYARAVEIAILMSVNYLTNINSNGTEYMAKKITYFSNYFDTNLEPTIRYVCYRPPVREVCTNYEMVEFQNRIFTPPEPRLLFFIVTYLFLYLPSLPYLCLMSFRKGAAPYCPNTLSTDLCCVSAHNNLPTWASPFSDPAYQCFLPRPYPSLSLLLPFDPPSLSPHLPNSCRHRTLAADKISSTVTFTCLYSTACLYHGTWSFPPSLLSHISRKNV